MRPSPTPLSFFCLTILCVSLPLLAQDRNYHDELESVPMRNSGPPLQQLVLINDSQKTIEAYDARSKCWLGNKEQGGGGTNYDTLTIESDTVPTGPSPDMMHMMTQPAVLAPGGRAVTQLRVGPQQSGCEWEAHVDAVIYADGTYGGDEDDARGLQGFRDGVVASVRDWVNTFNQPGATTPNIDEIASEAQRRKDKDFGKGYCADPLAVCKYWLGRNLIDSGVAARVKLQRPDETPDTTYRRVTQFIGKLNKKIQNDTALKVLDAVFPLPPSLAEQDYHQSPQPAAPTP